MPCFYSWAVKQNYTCVLTTRHTRTRTRTSTTHSVSGAGLLYWRISAWCRSGETTRTSWAGATAGKRRTGWWVRSWPFRIKVVKVAAASIHNLLVDDAGQVFSWGSGRYTAHSAPHVRPIAHSAEAEHCVSGVCRWSCRVVSCRVRCGRLGHGDTADVSAPKKIEALTAHFAVDCSVALWHSFVVTREVRPCLVLPTPDRRIKT